MYGTIHTKSLHVVSALRAELQESKFTAMVLRPDTAARGDFL